MLVINAVIFLKLAMLRRGDIFKKMQQVKTETGLKTFVINGEEDKKGLFAGTREGLFAAKMRNFQQAIVNCVADGGAL